MEPFSVFILEAGWGIFPVLIIGSASLVAALGFARAPRREVLAVVVALGVVTCLFGLLGTATGLQAAARHIGALSVDEKWIFLVGLREALNNLVAALLIVCIDGLVVSAALTRKMFSAPGATLRST